MSTLSERWASERAAERLVEAELIEAARKARQAEGGKS